MTFSGRGEPVTSTSPSLITGLALGASEHLIDNLMEAVGLPTHRLEQRISEGFKRGLDPWGAGSANLGRPMFAPNLPENACFKGIWGNFEAKMGRPKFADPTPHGSNPPLKTL